MSVLHDRPRCFACRHRIENDPVFAAACGHERCASQVWHGLCLMEWRDAMEQGWDAVRRLLLHNLNEHRKTE